MAGTLAGRNLSVKFCAVTELNLSTVVLQWCELFSLFVNLIEWKGLRFLESSLQVHMGRHLLAG
jgi:hypothetical protein